MTAVRDLALRPALMAGPGGLNRRGRPVRDRALPTSTHPVCNGKSGGKVVVLVMDQPSGFRVPVYARRPTEAAAPAALPAGPDLASATPLGGGLSRRELEVTRLVMAGMTNREIASRLFIAERTAEGHVERIRNKLGVRSRTEVAIWAARNGVSES